MYASQHEYAATPVDVLSRRLRLSFVDEAATQTVLPRTVELMAQTLNWTPEQAQEQLQNATTFYQRNGLSGVQP